MKIEKMYNIVLDLSAFTPAWGLRLTAEVALTPFPAGGVDDLTETEIEDDNRNSNFSLRT